ncbi:hypothetical protein [Mobiluncus mulieris]|uniref:hypothetical protein n=1 Tax=Mobiluncus mulieris TaxID=2052 RepID=UPI001B8D77C2|nr:hypothetical protein [Mobiluncus mulieris]
MKADILDLPDQAKVLQTVIAKKTQDNQPITPTPEKTATLKPAGKTQTTPGVTETPTNTTETKETSKPTQPNNTSTH